MWRDVFCIIRLFICLEQLHVCMLVSKVLLQILNLYKSVKTKQYFSPVCFSSDHLFSSRSINGSFFFFVNKTSNIIHKNVIYQMILILAVLLIMVEIWSLDEHNLKNLNNFLYLYKTLNVLLYSYFYLWTHLENHIQRQGQSCRFSLSVVDIRSFGFNLT